MIDVIYQLHQRPTHNLYKPWVWSECVFTYLKRQRCYCCPVAKSCLTLCDPTDCSRSGSSVHGISQARILEWVAISFSRGSFWPRDWICVSCIGMGILYHWATREAPRENVLCLKLSPYWITERYFYIFLHSASSYFCYTYITRKLAIIVNMYWVLTIFQALCWILYIHISFNYQTAPTS